MVFYNPACWKVLLFLYHCCSKLLLFIITITGSVFFYWSSREIETHTKYKKSHLNFTNEILFIKKPMPINKAVHEGNQAPKKEEDEKNEMIYYIPAYCRIMVKNIVEMHLQKLTGKVNFDIILAVYYGDLDLTTREFFRDTQWPKSTRLLTSINGNIFNL